MKTITTLILTGTAIALYGCSPSTPGGPGTAKPESEKPMIGQTDNTFTLDVPMMATKIEQGETNTLSIGIKRGTNFAQDVSLEFTDVPPGIHIQPDLPRIARTDEALELTLHAAEDAALGDFTVKVAGFPGTGAPANAELSLTISKHEVKELATVETEATKIEVEATTIENDAAKVESDAAKMEREEHLKQMRADLDALQVNYEDLKTRAAKEKGDAKIETDKKVAAAKVKLDEAEASLKEAKDAGPDRWEKIKEGFKGAADELKSMFE